MEEKGGICARDNEAKIFRVVTDESKLRWTNKFP